MNVINNQYIVFSWSEEAIVESVINRTLNYSKSITVVEPEDSVEKYALSRDDSQFISQQLQDSLNLLYGMIIRYTYGIESALNIDKPNYIGFKLVSNLSEELSGYQSRIELLDSLLEEYLIINIVNQWALKSGLDNISKELSSRIGMLKNKILGVMPVLIKRESSKSYLIEEVV